MFDYFVHIAYGLLLVSYTVHEIFWLRCIAVFSSLALIIFAYHRDPIFWDAVVWSCIFIAINLTHIWLILRERYATDLNADEKVLYEKLFKGIPIHHFKKFVKVGQWCEFDSGTLLIQQDQKINKLIAMTQGHVEIQKSQKKIAELKRPHFIGEMSYITGENTTADVITTTPVQLIQWSKESLDQFLSTRPELKSELQAAIGFDLVQKIKKQS